MNSLSIGLLALGVTFILLAVAAGLWARGLWARSGLPRGKVLYSDTGTWFEQSEPLYAPSLRLVGKPDYLVQERDGMIVPVELKSRKAPPSPYEGHVLQLAAYCLLVEAEFGIRPSYGILQYEDKAFAVNFTMTLEDEVLELLEIMHEEMYEPDLPPDHDEPWRCRACAVRDYCDQRLDYG